MIRAGFTLRPPRLDPGKVMQSEAIVLLASARCADCDKVACYGWVVLELFDRRSGFMVADRRWW